MKRYIREQEYQFNKQLLEINDKPCLKCNSVRVGVGLQRFKNNTEHIYAKCFNCKYQWYLGKDSNLDLSKLNLITTHKQKNREEALKQNLMDLILGD